MTRPSPSLYHAVIIALLLWVLIIFGVTKALASPFLTCDCTPDTDAVTGFQLQFGTQAVIDIPAVQTCLATVCAGTAKVICYDLGTMPQGAFSVKALAKNEWGVSTWTNPLSGTKSLPTSPSLLRIAQ